MFGLFKTPRINIRKKIPQYALTGFHAVESYADVHLADLQEVQRNHAVAYIVSVWACNTAMTGDFHLSQFTYRSIQKTGMLSLQMLSTDFQNRANGVVGELMKQGLIPR